MTAPAPVGVTAVLALERHTSHIVPPEDGVPGHVRAFEARVNGTAVQTLCGRWLVPSRDPRRLPSCQGCEEVFAATTGGADSSGLPLS